MFSATTCTIQTTNFDPNTYLAELQSKLEQLQDLVYSNVASAAQNQKLYYGNHSITRAINWEVEFGCQFQPELNNNLDGKASELLWKLGCQSI